MAGPTKTSSGLTSAQVLAIIAAAVGANQLVAEDGAGGITGVDAYTDSDARSAVNGRSALTIGGSGDSLTATTDYGTASVWTASPSGNITITTDLEDGQSGWLVLTPDSGKTVTIAQSGLTFTPATNSDAIGAISGDGSTTWIISMTRVNTIVDYVLATRS